ncbi:MAG: phage replisome organizer N-terminal domain-containing protein, partial [Lachnospiraceae bacterium]|nr:phage replisome organizer N-terminal domain-containing protein [Lachnospiraceae bacterium]
MAEKEKKYFWLKLPRNFFDKHYIKALRRKKHEDFPEVFGNMLVLFYVWMLAESIDHSGCLRYSESKPYDAETLSDVSDFPLHFVTLALPIFTELELVVTESDGTLFLPKSAKMIGSESASAQRVREHRERKKAAQENSETVEKPDKTAESYNVTQG